MKCLQITRNAQHDVPCESLLSKPAVYGIFLEPLAAHSYVHRMKKCFEILHSICRRMPRPDDCHFRIREHRLAMKSMNCFGSARKEQIDRLQALRTHRLWTPPGQSVQAYAGCAGM